MVRRWDYFVARSEHDVRTLVPALSVQGEILRTGYPRNDPLVQLRSAEQRAAVRAELGLPADATLVLYAPTFRETEAGRRRGFVLPIDLDQMVQKLPGHVLLVRTHYLQRMRLPAAANAAARDVSHLPDISPLLVAADVLVTDYSSVMFDFANTGRPMVFFTYDYDNYANNERGVYFELADQAPGPLVRTSDELIQALLSIDSWRPDYDDRYRRFISEFGEYDTGTAARQVVDRVFFGPARGQ
jgi:CDP-glycerol glycerophosphotransferase